MADDVVQSTPAGGETPASAPVAATPATPAALVPAATSSGTPQTPATGAIPEGYVPSYRLREAREAAVRQANEQFQSQQAQAQAQIENYRRQVAALTGISPQNQNPEVDAVRDQFGRLYPGLTKLEAAADQLLALQERAQDLEAQNQHYWETYGRSSTDRLFEQAEKALGGPLSEEGRRVLHSSFVGFIQSSPELTARYSKDPSLVNDFVKMFTSSFMDPVRRASAAGVMGRAGQIASLPQDTPGGAPSASPVPKLNGLDERVAAGWQMWNHNKNQ